jgi:hypothetical protein
MTPDVNIKDYYLRFIESAETDIKVYSQELEEAVELKNACKEFLDSYVNKINSKYNIDLNNFLEWSTESYNPEEKLYRKIIRFIDGIDFGEDRVIFYNILKYCKILKNIKDLETLIVLCEKRKNMKPSEYEGYIREFMIKVHKCILEGNGYKLSSGLGVLTICRWEIQKDLQRPIVDHLATTKNKERLLAEGKRLWNKEDALYHAKFGLPYDGVDYRIFKNITHFYELMFLRPKVFDFNNQDFQPTRYISTKLRGMTERDYADMCKSEEEIFNLQVGIETKLNVFLMKYPHKYVHFIRNTGCDRFNRKNFK